MRLARASGPRTVSVAVAHPVVLTSRAETAAGKLHFLCLACLIAGEGR